MTLMSLTSGAGPAPELSTSAAAVLGMLSLGARTGYDIQKAAEVSLRFFWAVSPAQVYGELHRLEATGMITGADDGRGARRRRSYTVTPAGHRALTTWLTGPGSSTLEIRDQTLLRLFFAATVTPHQADQILSDAHRRSASMIAEFDARILPAARRREREHDDPFPRLAAECGRALHSAIADWATAARAHLGVGESGPYA